LRIVRHKNKNSLRLQAAVVMGPNFLVSSKLTYAWRGSAIGDGNARIVRCSEGD
jgi:hypothetical protein